MKLELESSILEVIKKTYGIELKSLQLREPPKKELGDYAFNCGILSRELRKNPNIISEELIGFINSISLIESAEVDGAYINIKLSKDIFVNIFNTAYKNVNQTNIIFSDGNNKKIFIDYIGANIGKPLHIGHMCTPNQGQAMINIYKKLGYDVISDSHIGDWGIIFGKLISAYKLWGDEKRLEENAVDYLLELYIKITAESELKGEEIEQKSRDEFKLLSEGNSESIKLWEKFTKFSIEAMNIQLARLNVYPDYNIGESFYEGLGLPKMENYPDLKDDMHTIVKELISLDIATQNDDDSVGVIFGDNSKLSSCILQKRDGTHGYLASDIASIKYRVQNWNPEKIIYFVDSRQQLHLNQAFEVSRRAGYVGNTELFHAANGFISLKDGAMSTRTGKIIKLDKLLDEGEERARKIILDKRDDINGEELDNLAKIIGAGAIKYGYLKKSREIDVVFDWDEFMSFEGNSSPFIQYAYVRAIRILENYGKNIDSELESIFETEEEKNLIMTISNYKDTLEKTTIKNTPHVLCKYSYDLTKSFNSLYNNIHILNEEDELKKVSRLKLIKLFSETLKDSFKLLGIDMPNKM